MLAIVAAYQRSAVFMCCDLRCSPNNPGSPHTSQQPAIDYRSKPVRHNVASVIQVFNDRLQFRLLLIVYSLNTLRLERWQCIHTLFSLHARTANVDISSGHKTGVSQLAKLATLEDAILVVQGYQYMVDRMVLKSGFFVSMDFILLFFMTVEVSGA